jgi:hypothetical protein
MSEHLTAAELRVYPPEKSTPYLTVGDDLGVVEITEAAQESMDSGSIEIENTDGVIDGATRITSGDRLEFATKLAGETGLTTRWTAIARDVSDSLEGGRIKRVAIEATDFVFSVLSFRAADGSFETVDVAEVVDTLVAAEAPEIGRSLVETIGETVDINISGRYILDVLSEDLAPAGDAVVAADGTDLIFRPLGDVEVKHQLTPGDLHAPIDIDRVDDDLITRARIDGGEAHDVDDEQLTQSATARVTESSRLTTQIQTRKSEVARVQLYTEPDATSEDAIVVRLQAARDGAPVAIDDRSSDLARRSLAPEFLTDGGMTEFQLPDHSLSPGENPYLIVEAGGSDGHDIGTDGSGTPTFEAEYPYPLLARAEAGDARANYRRRDLRRRDDQLQTEQAVQDAATAALRHRSEPTRRVSATARSPRAHRLRPGEAVRLAEWPVSDVSGVYLCTERSTNYESTLLTTELTLADTTTI